MTSYGEALRRMERPARFHELMERGQRERDAAEARKAAARDTFEPRPTGTTVTFKGSGPNAHAIVTHDATGHTVELRPRGRFTPASLKALGAATRAALAGLVRRRAPATR